MYIFIWEIVFYYFNICHFWNVSKTFSKYFRNVSISEPTETTLRNEILILGWGHYKGYNGVMKIKSYGDEQWTHLIRVSVRETMNWMHLFWCIIPCRLKNHHVYFQWSNCAKYTCFHDVAKIFSTPKSYWAT